MTAAVNEAVIQFTEAKIELYEIIEVKICNFLLLQSNLNFWPQLSVIQVMSVLSREHLTGEVEMRDVATLMELMTKTISSARYLPLDRQFFCRGENMHLLCRCVVEFLKVMSTPLPTFGLPSKQQVGERIQNSSFSTLIFRMKMRILCCPVAYIALQRLQAVAIVQP